MYGLRAAGLRRRVGELLSASAWPRRPTGSAAATPAGCSGASTSPWARSTRARTDNGSAAVPAVLQALEAGGVRVASVTIARPSLDDVYLRHTGRSLTKVAEEVSR